MDKHKQASLLTLSCYLFAVWFLFGCGISGSIDRTTTTTTVYPDTNVTIEVIDHCVGEYSNTSWGSADSRAVHGCEAGGDAQGTDNSQMLALPVATLQALLSPGI